jgi:sugar O-acyltransferase (sialic acid O-acetyltransferase NeuD family)
VVADAARESGRFEVVGFLDDRNPTARPFLNATVLGDRGQLAAVHASGVRHLIFGFGDCRARLELDAVAAGAGFCFTTVVHPRAAVSTAATLGPGTFVAAGAVVNPGTGVGRHVIINTCASVDHDCEIEDGAHICPGVRLAGNVTVGRGSWVGIGSTVIEKIHIGPWSVIGAGSVVVKDIPAGVLAFGVPARVVRRLDRGSQAKR